MKITIYELLGLIKDGKAPLRIKYDDLIWILRDEFNDYFDEEEYLFIKGFDEYENAKDFLLEQVEILDEEDEFIDIEEIKLTCDGSIKGYYNGETHYITTNIKDKEVYIKLLNDLIKNQKKIINKLKEEGK